MKRMLGACVAALMFGAACGGDDKGTGPVVEDTRVEGLVEVREIIREDTTWEAGKTYLLKQHVFVDGATLTIPPGTRVLGEPGSSLVVQANARLVAEGTAEQPIVFTSSRPEGERAKGDWGGVVLLGRARINVAGGIEQIEGISGETARTEYGGTNDAHDCGSLRYVRIEFAGFELSKDNELNGLTVGACGEATRLDYVQVHRGADDGVEFFGGTAGIKHLLVTGAEDDGLDWDLGWRGKAQFLVIQQYPGLGNYAIEADSNGDALESEPRSNPEIWNATLIGRPKGGSSKSIGMILREGTAATLRHFVIAHFGEGAIDVADASSAAQFAQGSLSVKHSLFWDIQGSQTGIPHLKNQKKNAEGVVVDEDAAKLDESVAFVGNEPSNRVADPGLVDPSNVTAPVFAPTPAAAALVSELAVAPSAGFEDARFVGAVGETDWTAGWTAYPEK